MFAVILAGGFGTRLRPMVKDIPKPLAPINKRPFLEYVIENLKLFGVKEIIICLHYMAEKIQNYFGDGHRWGVHISYSIEEQPMGTGGAIGLLRNGIRSTFCVLNADTFLNFDFDRCLAVHKEQAAMATITLTKVEQPNRYGRIILDEANCVKYFFDKGTGDLNGFINAGLYFLEPHIFSYIKNDNFVSLEHDVFPDMIGGGEKIVGFSGITNFFDIGTPDDYIRFEKWVISNEKNGANNSEEMV